MVMNGLTVSKVAPQGAREMAQGLREHVALAEDLSLVPVPIWWLTVSCSSSSVGCIHPLLNSWLLNGCGAHRLIHVFTHARKMTHNNIFTNNKNSARKTQRVKRLQLWQLRFESQNPWRRKVDTDGEVALCLMVLAAFQRAWLSPQCLH